MSYDASLKSFSRTLIYRASVILPFCSNVFGVAPCQATGTPCWNTRKTCKNVANFTTVSKTYTFTSAEAPLPYPGPRPYLKKYSPLAPEIKDELTISGRIKLEFIDEPDNDVGIDPYVTQRNLWPNIPGTFWRKFVARNPDYKGAPVSVEQGFLGDAADTYRQIGVGTLDNLSFSSGGGTVQWDILDQIQALKYTQIPPRFNLKLAAECLATSPEIFLLGTTYADNPDFAKLDPAGYIKIDDEILHYSSADPLTSKLTIDQHGCFETEPTTHGKDSKIQVVKYYPPTNPFDLLKSMLLDDAGYPAANVDSDAFDNERDWYPHDIPFTAVIDEPTDAKALYMEVCGLISCRSWVNENAKITITRVLPNKPGRSYPLLTDAENVVKGSAAVDMGDATTSSSVVNYACGVVLYWDKIMGTLSQGSTEAASYNRVDAQVNPELFAQNLPIPDGNNSWVLPLKTIFCRWIRVGYLQDEILKRGVNNIVRRIFRDVTEAHPVITLDVELKDSDLAVGDIVNLKTDELLNPDGTDATVRSLIIRKEPKGSVVNLKLQRVNTRRFIVIAPAALAGLTYANATEAQREYGFIANAAGRMSDGTEGYYPW